MRNLQPGKSLSAALLLATSATIPTSQTLAESFLIDEVIVTAQKRAESVNDISMAISAFQGDDLEKLGLTDTRDMAGLVPGLTLAKSRSGTPIYTLRGVGFNSENLSSTSPVGVYIDEVSYPYPYMSQGLTFDVERVEVLKGPQGTLYGRNTTGGLINYIANKPTEHFDASIKAEYGKYDSYGIEAVINGALTDTLNARLAIKTHQSEEGWQKSASRGDELGEKDRTGLRLALDWEVHENVNALFTLGWWEDKSDTQAPQVIALALDVPGFEHPDLANQVLTNPDNEDADWDTPGTIPWGGSTFTEAPEGFVMDAEMFSVATRVDWQINDELNVTSITSYADLKRNDFADRDGSQYETVAFLDSGTIESFSQELRITAETDQFRYIAGVFYSQDDLLDESRAWAGQNSILSFLRAGASMADPVEGPWSFRNWANFADIETQSHAVFGQAEWDLNDHLRLTAGLRYTKDTADFEGCSTDTDGDGNIMAAWNLVFQPLLAEPIEPGECVTFKTDFSGPVDGPINNTLNENNLSGRLALDWQISENTMVYASFSRGFKSGNFPQLSGNRANQYDPVTQEELKAYEVGVKSALADNVQLNVSAYYYDYKDKQVFADVLDPVFVTLERLVNVPESEVKGIELDLTWGITDNLVTKLSAAYMDTEIEEFNGFDKAGNAIDFSGSEFEYSPDFQINGLVSYHQPLSANLSAQLTVNATYTSEQQGDLLGTDNFSIDAYTLLGANLSLMPDSEDWELSVWSRNLTGKYYWTSVQTQRDTVYRYAGMPRTWGLSFKYRFH
ncbi:TonB-dependent receptor [Pseudomaricurvus alkylphenolicus]|uniref:TonB-dependent receptor n=1 Tax=Pseudomaricurvus alkylphenolicus TaxID=1306991 RepID=UPI001423247E|nr:TonB-dependent receptor [Pseudomaricurvus alkylphenolicus]NIB40544.1 TonB-dependent receptor [Pseudomaricurvus alkylphenolicus]